MEKGRNACQHSVTLCEERIQEILAEAVCGGVYNERWLEKRYKELVWKNVEDSQ